MKRYYVSGYYRDSSSEPFTDYVIAEDINQLDEEDSEVFFYIVNEEELKAAIKDPTYFHDFTITEYRPYA